MLSFIVTFCAMLRGSRTKTYNPTQLFSSQQKCFLFEPDRMKWKSKKECLLIGAGGLKMRLRVESQLVAYILRENAESQRH